MRYVERVRTHHVHATPVWRDLDGRGEGGVGLEERGGDEDDGGVDAKAGAVARRGGEEPGEAEFADVLRHGPREGVQRVAIDGFAVRAVL